MTTSPLQYSPPTHLSYSSLTNIPSVKLTTVLDDTIVGAVYAYDPITSTISVITSPSPTGPGPHDVRILKVSFLKEVQVVGASATATRGFSNAEPRIGRFTRDDKKEAKATPRLVGRGVTKEGQEIMDALSRT